VRSGPSPWSRLLWLSLAVVLGVLPGRTRASEPSPAALSPRIANYTIQARLDHDRHVVIGNGTLRWRNDTEHATSELQFHLYYNAWQNDRSSFLRSPRGERLEPSEIREQDWGWIQLERLTWRESVGTTDLLSSAEYVAEDGNVDDRTVLRVPLRRSVAPGETIDIEMQWESKVPRTFARTGVRGDYYFVAQWFPKIGVLEPDGRWNCHQFTQTEFYADFGVYDVALTVPSGWIVGATGRVIETHEHDDGTTTHRFVQPDVHDFAWTTSPHYAVHDDRFEHAGLPPVDLRLLLMPDHAHARERYFAATKATLEHYGTWWGPYPYGHLTIVDPAYRSDADGMEYPTLFTGGTSWLSPLASRSPESVTVHEAGHQFWYGIVANNEFEHAWLDEGINSYAQIRTLEVVFPYRRFVKRYFHGFLPMVFDDFLPPARTDGADVYFGFHSLLKRDAMARPSWQNGPNAYEINAYNKPAMMLRTLENYLGWQTFQRVMSHYFARWSFRHPVDEDFFIAVREVSGQDMSWFFDQVYRDTVLYDYAVERVSSKPVRPPHGFTEHDGKLAFQSATQGDGDDIEQYQSKIIVRRWGDGMFPVDVAVTFSDGSTKTERWDGNDNWIAFEYRQPTKVERVEVDPDHKLVLDVDRPNNGWMRAAPTDIATSKWTSSWMLAAQHLLEFFALFS